MALSGLHVAFGFAGLGKYKQDTVPVMGAPESSQTMAAAGTSTIVAPAVLDSYVGTRAGAPIASVRSSADAWVAFGPTPNATTGARRYIAANTDYDFIVNPGDKLAWITA